MATGSPQLEAKLTGVPATMLATLLARSQDAKQPKPLLGDPYAEKVLQSIDFDYGAFGIGPMQRWAICLRGFMLDAWAKEFLNQHYEATILHLACGLDSRCFRVGWQAPGVRWIDVDLPDVVALRRKVYPKPEGDYQLVAMSVLDEDCLRILPNDRPTLVIMEGLIMYFNEGEAQRLLQRLVGHFPLGGQIAFDAVGWLAIRLQKMLISIHNVGAKLVWSLDNTADVEKLDSRLKLHSVIRPSDAPSFCFMPWWMRCLYWVSSHLPYLRDAGLILRYDFTQP